MSAARTPQAPPGGIPPTLLPLAHPIGELRPYPRNARNGDVEAISRRACASGGVPAGRREPPDDGAGAGGTTTYAAALSLGWEQLAVTWVWDVDEEQAARIVLVRQPLERPRAVRPGSARGVAAGPPKPRRDAVRRAGARGPVGRARGPAWRRRATGTGRGRNLAERFLVPPFSVLDARQGWWRERKRQVGIGPWHPQRGGADGGHRQYAHCGAGRGKPSGRLPA